MKDTPTTNIEAVKLYIAHQGQSCLFCGASDPEGSSFDVSDGAARQEMFCASCENEWTDSYHLASVIHGGEVYEPPINMQEAESTLKKAVMDSLADLWMRLRSAEHDSKPTDVMGEIAKFIAEKRGDTKPLCGCGGPLKHYDGMLGYEAMVCKSCDQHFPIL